MNKSYRFHTQNSYFSIRDHLQITTTKLIALGLSNPSMSVPPNGEETLLG